MPDTGSERTTTPAIVKKVESGGRIVDATTVELLAVCIERANALRSGLLNAGPDDGLIARELSIAITHMEDAITRFNKGMYRHMGKFAVTDAER